MARVVALVGVLIFALIAVGGLAAQYDTAVTGSQDPTTISNETFTVTENTTHSFAESHRDVIYNESVHVYQNDTEYAADGNYTWRTGSGVLFVPDGSELDGSNETASPGANITYNVTAPTGSQRLARDVGLLPFQLGEGLGIIVGAALVLTAVALAGRQR